jgi:hypothetical protein
VNDHSVVTKASPNFEIEFSPPPIAELLAMNVGELNSIDVEHDIVWQYASASTRRVREYESHKW